MFRCHVLPMLALLSALVVPSVLAPTAPRCAALPIPSERLRLPAPPPPLAAAGSEARPPHHVDARLLAPMLVLFIPWTEPKPTPDQPGGGGTQGQNSNGSGGNTSGGNTGGGNTGGGNTGGGNTGGGNTGGGSTGGGNPGDPGGKTTGSGDPGEPLTHPNPEPATLVSGLVGAGLLALASLRRRRWALAG